MEQLSIKPFDKNIRDLFLSGRQFVIPRFQREYSWPKRNTEEFLNDILDGIEIRGNSIKSTPYFVGTMLFVGNFTDNNKTDIQVVDGQQRLTTITILFSAMSNIFRRIGKDELSKTIFRYIMTQDDDGKEVRILKTKTSHPFFSFYIQDRTRANGDEKPTTEEEISIKQTFDSFTTRLEEKNIRKYYLDKKRCDTNGVDYVDILRAVRDQILGCTFVTIASENFSQAYKIFEILNAKGKHLQFIDLIKNKIFEVVKENEPADFAEEKWKVVKTSLESTGESAVGMATFFRHYWASKYKQCGTGKMFDDFRATLDENEVIYKELLQDMVYNVGYYTTILKPSREKWDNRKEYFWLDQSLKVLSNDFGIAQVRVALMPIMIAKDKQLLDMKLFKETILFLENFHFAYTAIMSGMANKLDSLYSKFAIALRKCTNKNDCNNVIVHDLRGKFTPLMPSFEQFRDSFVKLRYTKKNTSSNLKTRYAIRKLNAYYDGKEIFDELATVEHIIPEEAEDTSLNIGNLIALEDKLNGEAGNKTYAEKKVFYEKSEYKWIKSFMNDYPDWTSKDIESRAEEMAVVYYEKILQLER